MQMPLYHDEVAGEVHDFFRQVPVYQEQPTPSFGNWAYLAQTWPGMNSQNDGIQLGPNMAYMPGASNPRDEISNRSGQQSIERQNAIHYQGSNLQSSHSSLLPTVIRSQPRNQPLDFEGLFSASSNEFGTGNSFALGKERLVESSCAGQSVLYNHDLPTQSPEIMPQEQPSQNFDHFGGQIFPLANTPGSLGQQPRMDPNQVFYQQYIQEMHKQQQIMQLQQHFQLSRQQHLQWFLAAQHQRFGAQILQDQNSLKVGAEHLPFHFQPHVHLPHNLPGNIHLPLVNSSLRQAGVNSYPLGPGISMQQQLAPKVPTTSPSLLNCASNNRSGGGCVVPENSSFNGNLEIDHPQKFPFGQNLQGLCSASVAKNMNSYDQGHFQPSAELNYSAREQQDWSGISDHEENAQTAFCPRSSMTSSDLDQQVVKSPQEATMLLLRNPSVGSHQHSQQSESLSTRAEALNKVKTERGDAWRGALGMQPQSPVNNKPINFAHGEAHTNWNKLHLQNTRFQSQNVYQSGPEIQQRGWSDLSLHSGDSPLAGNTLHLFTDFESVENSIPQEQSSLQTERPFLALAGSAERPLGDWKTHALQRGIFHPGNSLQALLELDDDIDEDVSNQQVLQEALQIGGPFQSNDMEWQHEVHAQDQSMRHYGLDNSVTFTSDQSMSWKPEAGRGSVIENTQLCKVLASRIPNCFTSSNISQGHSKALKDCTQRSQGINGMLNELSRDVVSKEITGQWDGDVWEHGSLMGTNHEAVGVDTSANRIVQTTKDHILDSNSQFFSQVLDPELWASQQVRNMEEFGLQSWRMPPSNAISKTHAVDQRGNSILSNMGQRSNERSSAQLMLQGGKENLLKVNHSLLENLQEEKFSASNLEPNAELPYRLESTNLSGSLDGSSRPRSSLHSNNLISGWYNAEGTATESKKLNELIPSQEKVQQLPAQHRQLPFNGKQMHHAFIPSTNKELNSFSRIKRTSEANYVECLHGNDANNVPSPASSLNCEGIQHASHFASYSSAPSIRNTLQLLNKHDLSEGMTSEVKGVTSEVKQLFSMSVLQTESGSTNHLMPLSDSFQRQPISPQHCGLRLGPPSQTNSLTKDGRSFLSWHADNEKGCPGNESQRHGLLVSPQTRAPENGVELVKSNLSAEDSVLAFHPSPGLPVQSPIVANDAQDQEAPSLTDSIQLNSAMYTHPLPQVSSANCFSSLKFTPERRLADESISRDRVAVSSSSSESNPMSSSAVFSVANQELLRKKKKNVDISSQSRLWNDTGSLPFPQKGYLQASFTAPLPRQVVKSRLNLEKNPNQSTSKIDSSKNIEASIRVGVKTNSLAQPTLVDHPSKFNRKSKENMSIDLKDADSTGTAAQVKALEEATLPSSQGHLRVSAVQGNNSSVYFPTDILQSKLRATSSLQTDDVIQRPLHFGGNASTSSHKDATAKQQCVAGEKIDKGRSQLGILGAQCSALDSSNKHTSFHACGEVPNSRPQVTPTEIIQNAIHSSGMPSFQTLLPGSTVLSDQQLVTDIHLHKKDDGQADNQLMSSSFPKDLHESAQGYSEGSMQSKGVQPSNNSEKGQSSKLVKRQAEVSSSSSLAGPRDCAGQAVLMLQQSESVHPYLSSCINRPDTSADETIKTVARTTSFQGSPSKAAKTISTLPMKRKMEFPSVMPWHIAVNQSAELLTRTSGADELQWAAAVNCLPEKGDGEVDLRETSTQFAYRANQRLRLTTQLMQMIVPPAPATLMRSTTVEGRDSGTFTISKVLLGEVCSMLAGGGSTQYDPTSKRDDCSAFGVIDLPSEWQKLNVGTKFRAEAALKDDVEFKERAKRLEDCLSRVQIWILRNFPGWELLVSKVNSATG